MSILAIFDRFKQRAPEVRSFFRRSDSAEARRTAGTWNDQTADLWRYASPEQTRRRARALASSNAIVASAVDCDVRTVVGCGILPRWGNGIPAALKTRARDRWARFVDTADHQRASDLYGLMDQARRAQFTDGESFVRFLMDGTQFELQLMPPELINAAATGPQTVSGVEFDANGRRLRYHVYDRNPSLPLQTPQPIQVPADDMVHLFEPHFAGQVRGISELLPVLERLNHLAQWDTASIMKQKIAALLAGFIVSPDKNPLSAQQQQDGVFEASLEPGTMQRLGLGDDVRFSDPPDASPYDTFAKVQLRLIAAALGFPYFVLTGDLSDTSYASGRIGQLQFKARNERAQWSFIWKWCRPVMRRWLEVELLTGGLPMIAGGVDAYLRFVTWAPPVMPLLDPKNENDAAVTAIRAGLWTRELEIAARGYDLEEIDASAAASNASADGLGLVFDSDPRRVTQQGQEQASNSSEPPPAA